MSDSTALPLALTLGEPAGIGPDLTIQLWHRRVELRLPPFYLIADPEFIKRRARLHGLDVAVSVVTPAQATDIFGRALPISALDSPVTATPGRPDAPSDLGHQQRRSRGHAGTVVRPASVSSACPRRRQDQVAKQKRMPDFPKPRLQASTSSTSSFGVRRPRSIMKAFTCLV